MPIELVVRLYWWYQLNMSRTDYQERDYRETRHWIDVRERLEKDNINITWPNIQKQGS